MSTSNKILDVVLEVGPEAAHVIKLLRDAGLDVLPKLPEGFDPKKLYSLGDIAHAKGEPQLCDWLYEVAKSKE